MSSVMRLSFLLMISVVFAEPSKFLIYPRKNPEFKNLTLSSSSMKDQHEGNQKTAPYAAPPKWQKNPLFCCTCQDFVKITKPKVDKKIQLKINKFCDMFIKKVKATCLNFGGKLKKKILQLLFPGKIPRDTCQKVKLCLY